MIRAPLGRAGRALAAAFLGITWPAWAQEHVLSNDAFLPTAKTSQEKLAQGDALCAQLLEKEGSEREWEQVFELWRSAVELAGNAPVALLPPEQEAKAHPDEKPPFVDGCLFASLFEGPKSFEVGTALAEGTASKVKVHFAAGEGAGQDFSGIINTIRADSA